MVERPEILINGKNLGTGRQGTVYKWRIIYGTMIECLLFLVLIETVPDFWPKIDWNLYGQKGKSGAITNRGVLFLLTKGNYYLKMR
jgi:hypothetical protein